MYDRCPYCSDGNPLCDPRDQGVCPMCGEPFKFSPMDIPKPQPVTQDQSFAHDLRVSWNKYAQLLHATHREKGFAMPSGATVIWDGNQIALMHGELSEAHEALRKDLMDDKLTHRKGIEVELADVIIRIMNYASDRDLDVVGAVIEKAEFNKSRPFMHGGKKF